MLTGINIVCMHHITHVLKCMQEYTTTSGLLDYSIVLAEQIVHGF